MLLIAAVRFVWNWETQVHIKLLKIVVVNTVVLTPFSYVLSESYLKFLI